MRATGIIPVRMDATRFPGKPLADLRGKPVVRWVWDALGGAGLIYPRYVATPDPEIIAYCEAEGIEYLTTARSCRNGTERVYDSMRQLAFRSDEIVINVQGDEPTIRPESLDELARAFNDPSVEIASLFHRPVGHAYMRDANRVKVILQDNGDAFAFTRQPVRWNSRHGIHVGVYAYRRAMLPLIAALVGHSSLEQTAWLRAGKSIRMIEIPYETQAIDCPGDIEKAARILCP
jgi:3-deoxy-manno-octulosonate cytidylyltransferase (CMP-KDO synthetase)